MSKLFGKVSDSLVLLSACMIVKNGEATLEECLRSLAGLVDEVVIIDGASEDRSVEIAKDLGACVYEIPWPNDFARQRNRALRKAKGRWGLTIDHDNVVVDTDIKAIRKLLTSPDTPPALIVKELLKWPGGQQSTVMKTRLFRLDMGFEYRFPVHEQLKLAGHKPGVSDLTMVHYGYETTDQIQAKEERNLAIALTMPDNRHGFYRRAKSARSLHRWGLAVAQCKAVLECSAPRWQLTEACVLGAISAFNAKREDDMGKFMEQAWLLAPDSPDVLYMELLALARRYAAMVRSSPFPSDGSNQSYLLRHSSERALGILAYLSGSGISTEDLSGHWRGSTC